MNTQHIEEIAALPETEFNRLVLGAQVELKKEELSDAKVAFQSTLPYATPDQFEVVRHATEHELEVPAFHKVGEDFMLDDTQKAVIKIAKDSRKDYLSKEGINLVGRVIQDKEQVVTSFKVRALKSGGTRTTATFTKNGRAVASASKAKALLEAIEQAKAMRG